MNSFFFLKNDNTSSHRTKKIQAFLYERYIKTKDMASKESWSKSYWKFVVGFLKMLYKEIPSSKDLLTPIRRNWCHFDKVYCFKSIKSMTERIKAVIKAPRVASKN